MAALPILKDHPVWTSGLNRITYDGDVNVAAAGNTVFSIPVPSIKGRIHEVSFESASEACDVSIAEKDAQLSTSHMTVISMEGINLGYSPELAVPRYYHNQDTTPEATLYVRVDNTNGAIDTGTAWFVVITFESY